MTIWLELLSLLVIGWVAGAELRAWGFVRPTIRRLPYEPQVAMEQGMLRHFGPLLAVLLPLGVVLAGGLVYVSPRSAPDTYWLRLAAAVCIVTTLVTTLVVNVPINTRTAAWQMSADAHVWNRMRARWHAFQGLRAMLFTAAFIMLAMAQVLSNHAVATPVSAP